MKIERANLGPCPVCGREIIENRKGYSCWSREDPGCGFVIWKKKAGKNLPVSVAKELIESLRGVDASAARTRRVGRTEKPVTGFRGRSGRTFRAKLKLEQTDEGKWRVEFDEDWAKEPPAGEPRRNAPRPRRARRRPPTPQRPRPPTPQPHRRATAQPRTTAASPPSPRQHRPLNGGIEGVGPDRSRAPPVARSAPARRTPLAAPRTPERMLPPGWGVYVPTSVRNSTHPRRRRGPPTGACADRTTLNAVVRPANHGAYGV